VCLLVIAWRTHPEYRLLLAANRDEFYDRPAAPLSAWSDSPGIWGGRDLSAGGTWLALADGGRLGVVTNYRELARKRRSAPSRGGLIPSFLQDQAKPQDYLGTIELDATGYAGFNLLLANEQSLWYASNRADGFARELPPGLYGLSNHALDTPWPKLLKVKSRFAALVDAPQFDTQAAFEMLSDREPVADAELVSTGLPLEWERALSAAFVRHENYGTRASTVVSVRNDGSARIQERRFDAAGSAAGETTLDL
jgi:uncharacterized protein with NRDE domain